MNSIVVGTDFSVHGMAALQEATRLAIALEAELVIVHAFPPERMSPVLMGQRGKQIAESRHQAVEVADAIRLTQDWAEWARGQGAVVQTVAEDLPATDLILKTARDRQADMIVVGTHQRRGVGRVFLGSVSENIVHRCEVPVVVVPAFSSDEVAHA